jgi:endopolyphosphatase
MLILQAFWLFAGTVWSFPVEQQPLIDPSLQEPPTLQKDDDKPALRKLQGRFLHITGITVSIESRHVSADIAADVHPDSFFEPYSSTDSACHSGTGSAGILGAEISDCDTPKSLVNATFQWINDNLKDEIDFVIWTGDSARHDNDEDIPRTEKQIVDSNKMLVEKFVEVFGKDDNIDDPDPTNDFVVPIVPTFGNNDILPHNIFEPGPNRWTRDYADIWIKFIPEAQRHSFARGGWFFTEVIPQKLAVFSLNTMYFFDSNTAVDGCDAKSEPGYEHMEWLRVQLQFMRERGMKAIMTGHVPPARTANKQSWDETCWQKYSLWMKQYRDVVVAGMFGHMNIDHFMIQDAAELKYNVRGELEKHGGGRSAKDPMLSVQSKAEYMTDLRDGWKKFPTPPMGMSYSSLETNVHEEAAVNREKKANKSKQEKEKKFLKEIGGKWAERFSVSLVSPSVVPNYFPTLRVVEYNISGLENEHPAMGKSRPAAMETFINPSTGQDSPPALEETVQEEDRPIHDLKKRNRKSKHKKNKKKTKPARPPFKMPEPPTSATPPGPAYSSQALTLLSYTQYYANLTFINNDFEESGLSLDEYIGTAKANRTHPKKFDFQIEYDTKTDKRYKLKDMTVRSYMDLAHSISKDSKNHKKGIWDLLPDEDLVDIRDSDSELGREAGYSTSKKKKHGKKGKGKKRKGKGKEKDTLWHTFVKRAFVMTKTDEDMEDFEPDD